MPYTTPVAGTVITVAWATANVRDQVITPFATAVARDAAILAPLEGMIAHLADSDTFTWYDGTRWGPMPGTIIARGNRGTTSSTTASEVGVLRLSGVPLKQGHLYLIKTSPLHLLSTAANDFVFAKIRYTVDGSTPTTGSTVLGTVQAPTGASQSIVPMTLKYIPGSDLTFTPLLTVGRSAGSGNCSLAVGASVSPEIDLMVIAAGLAPADTGTDI